MNCRIVQAAAVLVAVLAAACGQAATALPGRLPGGVEPRHYELTIEPDAQALTFTGRARIDVDVNEPTDQVVLNAADLSFAGAEVDGKRVELSMDAVAQTVTLRSKQSIAAGKHVLQLEYRGVINRSPAGLFAMDYANAQGSGRMLATQFEPADARRFAPLWDEPGRKATFSLRAIVPAAQSAFSNMPVQSTQAQPDGRKAVRFATSPKMSAYLLFLAVGDLERHARVVDGVELAVVTRRGVGAQAQFALDAAAQLLPYFNDYFGVRYPLPKLDLIAGPGTSQFFGAMENWGANFYFERYLLVDPATSSESDRQLVYRVVAHELAHQWFGDLVTMSWWDDLWLNEGFASWLGSKATHHFKPQWNIPAQSVVGGREVLGGREEALTLDARSTTHPIVQPIASAAQASLAFDKITYEKGQAVIGMLESWLGADAFRDGVRSYMKRHAYGNTTTADLWKELAAASGKPIMQVARDFVEQPGVPLLRVSGSKCNGGSTEIRTSQQRFAAGEERLPSLQWHVPVRLRTLDAASDAEALVYGSDQQSVTVPGCDPVVVNSGQASFVRTSYAPELLAELLANFGRMPLIDQAGLLVDTRALGEAGYQPVTDYLELVEAIPAGADPLLWRQVANAMIEIDRYFDGASPAAFRAWTQRAMRPSLQRIGWNAAANEGDTAALLREQLIVALGMLDDESVVKEARARFEQFQRRPESLPAPIRKAVLAVVATHADSRTWEAMHALARSTSEPLARDMLYQSLAFVRDAGLVQRTLEIALSDEPPETTGPSMIANAALAHPERTFEFARRNAATLLARLEPAAHAAFIPRLADTSNRREIANAVRDYALQHIPVEARGEARLVAAGIEIRADVVAKRVPQIERWLSSTRRDDVRSGVR